MTISKPCPTCGDEKRNHCQYENMLVDLKCLEDELEVKSKRYNLSKRIIVVLVLFVLILVYAVSTGI